MISYTPVIVPLDLYPKGVKEKLEELASVFAIIEKEVDFITEIGCRGGYIQDTLRGIEPSDFDLIYATTDDSKRCRCKDVRDYIMQRNFPLFRNKKVDLGHLEPEEMYLPLTEKTVGPYSHHDMSSRFFLNSRAEVWTCRSALEYLNEDIYEISFLGWLEFMEFPLTQDLVFKNYYLFIVFQTLRSIRMIYKKKYTKLGEEFKASLQLFPQALEYCLKNNEFKAIILDYTNNQMKGMSHKEISITLNSFNIEFPAEITKSLQDLQYSEK